MKSNLVQFFTASGLAIILAAPILGAKGGKGNGGGGPGGGKCENVPLRATIIAIPGGVLSGDGASSTYEGGVINLCSGSNDATLNSQSGRTIGFTFPDPVENRR